MGKGYDYLGNVVISTTDEDISELEDLLPNRLLIWHDEFKKASIDREKWGAVNSLTRNISAYTSDLDKVANTGDGLIYRAIKDYPNPSDGVNYSLAYLSTNNLFEFRYGRIEAKMKFPSTTPHHSTLWMLGANSERLETGEFSPYDGTKGVLFPSCGEVDIAEFDNGTVGARAHWDRDGFDGSGTAAQGGNVSSLVSTPTDWHIYACEWTETSITFFVDGVQKGTWNTSNATVNGWNPFNHPFYLILNCIVSLNGTPTWDVAETQVKWVRVYAPAEVTEYITETAISIPSTASIAVGERSWLGTPTFTPANPSDMTVKWLSHNDDIVTCHGGMLIGVSAGTTYVQATSKHGYTALCKVTVA